MTISKHCIIYTLAVANVVLLATGLSSCDDTTPIPEDRSQVSTWFKANVLPFSQRQGTLDNELEIAERNSSVIEVRQDGNGHFKTVSEAIASVPDGNSQRVIVKIWPGVYNEKILIPATKPFITLRGTRNNMPVLQFNGTAKEYGTYNCASVMVMADYFTAIFIVFKNTSPRPDKDHAAAGAQAVALRLKGDKAALYGCKMYGYQDTLLDDSGHHFIMSCFIQGTVDFIFGGAKSIYLQTKISVLEEDWKTVIAAQGNRVENSDAGFSFVHCVIFGNRKYNTFLGRGWLNYSNVVYSYSTMTDIILPQGWDNGGQPEKNMLFGEYQNNGAGSDYSKRVPYSTQLSPSAAQLYLTLSYINASTWLLPPCYT